MIYRVKGEGEAPTDNRWQTLLTWLASTFSLCATSFALAWGIPIFEHIFSLMGALFGTHFALVFPALFWFHNNLASEEDSEQGNGIAMERKGDLENGGRSLSQLSREKSAKGRDMVTSQSIGSQASTAVASDNTARTDTQQRWSKRRLRRQLHGAGCLLKDKPLAFLLHLSILVIGIALVSCYRHGTSSKQY